jgi:hypothetical protein
MQLLVAPAADMHSALEVASWIVAIVGFGLVILQLFFYWFGRNAPLAVRVKGHDTRTAEVRHVLLLDVEFRSRTRDTQTVRELLLFKPPNAWARALRPWWYEAEVAVIPVALPSPSPLPLTVEGHDTVEVRVAFYCHGLPYGSRTRLKVRASRRRPHVARIRMKTEEPAPPPTVSMPFADGGEQKPDGGEQKTTEQDPARTRASRIAHTVRRFAPALAALMMVAALSVLARACSRGPGG